MAEESKQAFDPDSTVAQPVAGADPEATVTRPMAAVDPETTITGPLAAPGPDPEATITGPLAKPVSDPEATGGRPRFDPDATLNPVERERIDPDATVRIASLVRAGNNPFAPKSPPDTIQANLSALGGLNPLVALANRLLAAVPQIRSTLKHPDAAGLLVDLRNQLESLETSAVSAEYSDDTVAAAVYALCALLDESAAATPWGGDWIRSGLLQSLRGESGGGEGFFVKLDQLSAESDGHADLLEFFYICLALGFEGRYRDAENGRQALTEIKDRLYALITRRRPRPEGLSERWRTPAAQAAADAALATAAQANAARAAAAAAALAPAAANAEAAPRFALARLPRRAIWSAVAGVVGASVVFYLLALRLLEDETRNVLSAKTPFKAKAAGAAAAPAPAPAPVAVTESAAAALSKALAGLPVAVSENSGQIALELRHDRQFAPGGTLAAPEVQALLRRIAEALERLPGSIVVIGHADATPPGSRHASNAELSAARARAAAQLMAPALRDPARLATDGRGEGEPLAPNDSADNRAKNRRVAIVLKPAP